MFERSVADCNIQVSSASIGAGQGGASIVLLYALHQLSDARLIRVGVINSQNFLPFNANFHLLVFCPQMMLP